MTRTFEEILQEGSQKLNRLINEAKVDPRKALAPVMGKKVEIDWSSVRDVNISGHAMGGSSQGVFVMKINGERQAVKISTPGSQGNLLEQPGYIEAIQIQRILGDMGYAPKLFEIYEGENLKRVINQINSSTITNKIPVESKGLRYGIRMEEIQDVWVYDRAEDIAPFFKNWNKDQLTLAVNRIRELENVVNRLHISAGDAQIFLSPDGRIILGDLDFYRMSKGPGQNDFTGLIQELLNKWEIRHGSDAIEQLTPAERAKFLYPELKG